MAIIGYLISIAFLLVASIPFLLSATVLVRWVFYFLRCFSNVNKDDLLSTTVKLIAGLILIPFFLLLDSYLEISLLDSAMSFSTLFMLFYSLVLISYVKPFKRFETSVFSDLLPDIAFLAPALLTIYKFVCYFVHPHFTTSL